MLQQQKTTSWLLVLVVVACVAFACCLLSIDAAAPEARSLLQRARSSLSSSLSSSLASPQHAHLQARDAAAAFPLPRSQAEQQQHDSTIRVWIPPFFALCASIVLGITSAGEGITFMMLWTFAGQFGLLGTDYTFQKAVFYTSFFPVFCSPPILYAARHELKTVFGYGLLCACIMCPMAVAGQHVLLSSNVAVFKIVCAIGALAFAVYNLVVFAWEHGKDRMLLRAASSEPLFAATQPQHSMFEYDESLCIITNCPSRPETPHWRCLLPFYNDNPRVRYWVEFIFPRISEAHRKTESCVVALTLSSVASGFLLGLTGSATSPTLMAFSFIDATKASIRGIIVLGHGCAALVTLFSFYSSSSSHLFVAAEAPVYCATAVAALLGAAVGTWLRQFIAKDRLMAALYVLIWVDAFIFLGVFGSSGGAGSFAAHAAAAWVFWASSLVLALVIAAVIAQPQVVQTCVDGVTQWLHAIAPDSYRPLSSRMAGVASRSQEE